MSSAPPCAFVIFGVTGDLSARKLMPALFALHRNGRLSRDSRIVGFGRSDWTDERLRDETRASLREYAAADAEPEVREFVERLSYVRGAYDEPEAFARLAERLEGIGLENRVFYTATPPGTYESIARGLAGAGLQRSSGASRLVIEKPFGHDSESARSLNRVVLESFDESQVYRIDHYLAKETAQNLAALRFGNAFFEPLWSRESIDHVQITMAEPIGIEGRGSFYEEAGVIRDVFQNHLLQLLALVATEPPATYDATSVRDEKVKVLRAVACPRPEGAVVGQYVRSGDLRGYREEDGVDARSRQGTFLAAELFVNNWRWAGVPFFLRTGKRLEAKTSEIVLHFRKPPHVPFRLREALKADRLVLRLVPDEGITLRFNAKRPGQGTEFRRVSMDFYYDEQFERPAPDAYETLLLDAMRGDATLFMRADEVEEQWRIVAPLLERWESASEEPAFYPAGSWGPREAVEMLARSGRVWSRPEIGRPAKE